MELKIIILILCIHWFADFVLQTDWQAKNKSSNDYALSLHVTNYSITWLVFTWFIFNNFYLALGFSAITFFLHWCTDYFTSRINTKLWNKGEVHYFFVSIGFDQVLHYVQLFGTYYLLK